MSHLVYKCHILNTSVASVENIILPSCLCRASNDIIRTLKTPQRLVLKKRDHLTRSTNLFPLKEPLKNGFWRGALLYPLLGSVDAPWASLGECFSALCTLLGEWYHFMINFWVCWDKSGKNPSIPEGGWIRIYGQGMILGKIHNWRRGILNLSQISLKWLGLSKPI